jgi:hypothetical protein
VLVKNEYFTTKSNEVHLILTIRKLIVKSLRFSRGAGRHFLLFLFISSNIE